VLAPKEIDEYILPNERRVIRVRTHWVVMLNHMTETLFLIAVLFAIDMKLGNDVFHTISWYIGLVAVSRLAIFVAEWWVERLVITDKRVMRAGGILTHQLDMMPLGKVTDLTFQRTFTGRLMGYGHMRFESAGQIQSLEHIKFAPQPEEIYEALTELIFGEKGKTRSHNLGRPKGAVWGR
jgi:uncharacterized membrane protein YdbT with pleckstrin-like domain